MKKIWKFLAIILMLSVSVSCLFLASCDNGGEKPDDGDDTDQTEEPEELPPVYAGWEGLNGTKLTTSDDRFLVIRGENAVAQCDLTLTADDDLWVDYDYRADGAEVTVKTEITIGSETAVVADAIKVKADQGVCNLPIPLLNYFDKEDYSSKTATLKLTVTGATADAGLHIRNVTVAANAIAGTDSDPLNDTFLPADGTPVSDQSHGNLESWYKMGHYDSMENGFDLGTRVFVDWGRMAIDGSDRLTGGTNTNINSGVTKVFTVPDIAKTQIRLNVLSSDVGTDVMVIVIVEGKVYHVTDGWLYISNGESRVLSCGLENQQGKKAQIIVMQRDSSRNNGDGELMYLTGFSVGEFAADPLNNEFLFDLEDWGTGAVNTSVDSGFAVMGNNAKISKTLTLPVLDNQWRQKLVFGYKTDGEISYKVSLTVDGTTHVLQDWKAEDQEDMSELSLFEGDFDAFKDSQLSGKQVTLTLETKDAASGATFMLDAFRVQKDWLIDPYNNQFLAGPEDWVYIGGEGAPTRLYYDATWTRIQIDYAGGWTTIGKTFTMPENPNVRLGIDLEGNGPADNVTAGTLKIELTVDGKAYTLQESDILFGRHEIWITLSEVDALKGVEYAGKEVTYSITCTAVDGKSPISWLKWFRLEQVA